MVDNAIDEALAGYCDNIDVTIHDDGSVSVSDDGRGIPVDTHEEHGRPAVEVVMTILHAGGKFDNKSYQVSGGLHGVGVSVVNALSKWLEVEVRRDGALWKQRFDHGKPEYDLKKVRDLEPDEETGTTVRFWPDDEIFETGEFKFSTLSSRLRELAFLNSGVAISIIDERDGETETFAYDGGIREFVEYLNETKDPLHRDIIYFEDEEEIAEGPVQVEIAMQGTDDLQALFTPSPTISTRARAGHTSQGSKHRSHGSSTTTRPTIIC